MSVTLEIVSRTSTYLITREYLVCHTIFRQPERPVLAAVVNTHASLALR